MRDVEVMRGLSSEAINKFRSNSSVHRRTKIKIADRGDYGREVHSDIEGGLKRGTRLHEPVPDVVAMQQALARFDLTMPASGVFSACCRLLLRALRKRDLGH